MLAFSGSVAGAGSRGPSLLPGPGVPVQRAPLDRLVNRLDELAVLAIGGGVLAGRDSPPQAGGVGLDPRHVAAVLEPLALGAEDALLLRGNVCHGPKKRRGRSAAARPYYSGPSGS